MTDLSTRSRAEAQRDIAVRALQEIDNVGQTFKSYALPDIYRVAGRALARIAEIEKTAPKSNPTAKLRIPHWANWFSGPLR